MHYIELIGKSKSFLKLAQSSLFNIFNRFLSFNNAKTISEDEFNDYFKEHKYSFIGNCSLQNDFKGTSFIKFKNQDTQIRFYLKPADTDSFKLIESFIIPKTGNIPTLYGYNIKEILKDDLKTLSKKAANYDFLIQPLSILASNFSTNIFIVYFEELVKENITKLNEIKRLLSGELEVLGAGADGIACKLNDSMVFKLFRNQYSYQATKEAFDRLHKEHKLSKTEAMIYDVGYLGEFAGKPLFFSILEKMTPAESMDLDTQNELTKLIEFTTYISGEFVSETQNKMQNFITAKSKDPKLTAEMIEKASRKDVSELVEKAATYLEPHIKLKFPKLILNLNKSGKLSKNWLHLFIVELLLKSISNRNDLHVGNLGISNMEFRYFDPAYHDEGNEYQTE